MSSVLGDPYTSRHFADQIRWRRNLYPPCVQELLRRVESDGGDTCPYYSILPDLRQVLAMEDELFRAQNQQHISTRGWPLENELSYTNYLVGIIEEAFRNNIPIDRPMTHEERQAWIRRQNEINHAYRQEMQAEWEMANVQHDETAREDSDEDPNIDRCR